ncbi:MAG TPA: lysylphosphatidylglycerol synthase transmembrane domain-containing protein [Armatimonadota bacterium]|jgi:hypothetical protein
MVAEEARAHPARASLLSPPLWLRAAVSVLLLALLVSRLELGQVARAVAAADRPRLFVAFLLGLGTWVVATWKWQLLLSSVGVRAGYLRLVRLNLIGIFYGVFLPSQVAGQVVKGLKLAREEGEGAGVGLSVVADPLTMHYAAVLVGLMALGYVVPGSLWVMAIPAVVLMSSRMPDGDRLPTGAGLVRRAWRAAVVMTRRPGPLVAAVLLSVVFQMLSTAMHYQLALALGLPVSFRAMFYVVSLVCLAQAVPVSLGGMGVRETSLVVTMASVFHISPTRAAGVSALFVLYLWLLAGLGGLLELTGGASGAQAHGQRRDGDIKTPGGA